MNDRLSTAAALERAGLLREAAAAYLEAAGPRPGAAASFEAARLLRQLGDHAAAFEVVSQGLAGLAPHAGGNAQRASLLHLQANLLTDANEYAAALQALDAAIRIAPTRASLHHDRAVTLQRLARHADALAAHDAAAALGLTEPDALYNRGNTLQSLLRHGDAQAAYRSALALRPSHELALYDLARLRWRLGDPAWSQELDDAATVVGNPAVPLGIKARLTLRAGDAAAAAAAYERAAKAAPESAAYADGLAQALSRLSRFDEAQTWHQRAQEIAGATSAAVWITHAQTLLRSGQATAAAAPAERALRLDPVDQEAWATLSLVWRALGDPRADWLLDEPNLIFIKALYEPALAPAALAALSAELTALHVDRREPIDQTLRGGTQTMGNLFDSPSPALADLRQRTAAALSRWVDKLADGPRDSRHPVTSRIGEAAHWRYSDSWSSRLGPGGHHTAHVHSHGWLSAVAYVTVPPATASAPAHAGWLEFGAPDFSMPELPAPVRQRFEPQPGTLVVFPSYYWHGTVPFSHGPTRLTVAFDVLPVDD